MLEKTQGCVLNTVSHICIFLLLLDQCLWVNAEKEAGIQLVREDQWLGVELVAPQSLSSCLHGLTASCRSTEHVDM